MDKVYWREKLSPFVKKSNPTAYWQIFSTLFLYGVIWYAYATLVKENSWVIIPFALLMSLFVLRFFVLMHDCGHGALFSSPKLNNFFGYVLGVLTGMPQYVWSMHHAYHHTTNGDWEKYKGPLSSISLEEYKKMTPKERSRYRLFRNPFAVLFLGGFLYVFFNPRFNWIVGTARLGIQSVKIFFTQSPKIAFEHLKKCPSNKWKNPKEFRHQAYNNLTLFVIWYFMIAWLGVFNFFAVYILTLTLSGGLGILFFTVQHNFEDSYASDTSRVDSFKASLEGTSYLVLPKILNWFTADIGYHHIHHLSVAIPNYNLEACHRALEAEFKDVRRITMSEIYGCLFYLLWDRDQEKIISFKDADKALAVSL